MATYTTCCIAQLVLLDRIFCSKKRWSEFTVDFICSGSLALTLSKRCAFVQAVFSIMTHASGWGNGFEKSIIHFISSLAIFKIANSLTLLAILTNARLRRFVQGSPLSLSEVHPGSEGISDVGVVRPLQGEFDWLLKPECGCFLCSICWGSFDTLNCCTNCELPCGVGIMMGGGWDFFVDCFVSL